MSALDAIFADLWSSLAQERPEDFRSFPGVKSDKPEQQHTDNKDFSGVSGVSGPENKGGGFFDQSSSQAREGAGGRAGARGYRADEPEIPETPEKIAPAMGYISGSPFRKPEKSEKTGNLASLRVASRSAPADPEAFEERAAHLEYDCGLSRAEAEAQARAEMSAAGSLAPPLSPLAAEWRQALYAMSAVSTPCPGYRGNEWPGVLARAVAFLDTFGEQAEALGWTAPRLFGVHPTAGVIRVDACGALMLPVGGPVRAITADTIGFGHLTHREKPGQLAGVPVWELGLGSTGSDEFLHEGGR